jgi:hypothetical protein
MAPGRAKRARPVENTAAPSALWLLLMSKYALGKLTALDVQQIADAAHKSGACAADLVTLAGLGARGNSPQNAQRDLERAFFKNPATPTPTLVPTTLRATPVFAGGLSYPQALGPKF